MSSLMQTQFHDHLNRSLWYHNRLRPEVRLKLFQAAVTFYRFLEVPRLMVSDIILTGSNAAYNYTAMSDIDVHLIVDFKNTTCPSLASNFFTTKKALWSKTYDVTIRHHQLELYVEDANEPVNANGIYSILHDEWIKHPKKLVPTIDDRALQQKTDAFVNQIDSLLESNPSIDDINRMLKRLYILRHNGLLNGGEFSIENLCYKTLRAWGYLQKLYDARIEARDAELSLS